MGPVAAQYPLIVGEIGEGDCSHNFIDPLMTWLDSIHARFIATQASTRLTFIVATWAGRGTLGTAAANQAARRSSLVTSAHITHLTVPCRVPSSGHSVTLLLITSIVLLSFDD